MIEQAILDAIGQARWDDPECTVTVIAPNLVAGLQWRRRVARLGGSLFNIRWLDLSQFAQELVAGSGESVEVATQAVQIAAAWRALQEGPEVFAPFREAEEMPAQLVRAFDTLDALDEAEREKVLPSVLELHGRYVEMLAGKFTHANIQSQATKLIQGMRGETAYVLLKTGTTSDLQARLYEALAGRVRTVSLDEDFEPAVEAVSVHDELDEVNWALARIQDEAVDKGVPVYDMAVIIPGRNPYGKLFEWSAANMNVQWNGLAARSLAETIPGIRLQTAPVGSGGSWGGLVDEWCRLVDAGGVKHEIEAQAIKDQLEAWGSVGELVPQASPSLVSSLRKALLARPIPRERGYGDGVFAGTSWHLEGLSFERLFILGFTNTRYPASARAIPLLPPGLSVPNVEAQREALGRNMRRSKGVVLSYARCDRRSGREAFPSPWMGEWVPDEIPSSIALLMRTGPRSEAGQALACALRERCADEKQQAVLEAWESGDLECEASVQTDLTPHKPISPSQLETFLKCPRRWFYAYVLGLKEPEVKPSLGLAQSDLGSIVHGALAKLFELRAEALKDPAYSWTDEDRKELSATLFAEAQKKHSLPMIGPERAEIYRWLRRLDAVLIHDQDYRRESRAVPIRTELRLEGEIAGLRFCGKSDRIDVWEDGTLAIIDYKTGKSKGVTTAAMTKDPIIGGATLQGLVYGALAGQSLGGLGLDAPRAVDARYWFFSEKPQKMEAIQNVASGVERLEEAVSVAGQMMRLGLTPMRPKAEWSAGLCGYCPFTNVCPGDRDVIAQRQADRADGVFKRYLDLTGKAEDAEELQ